MLEYSMSDSGKPKITIKKKVPIKIKIPIKIKPAKIKPKIVKKVPITWNNIQKRAGKKGLNSGLSAQELSALWKTKPNSWKEIDSFINAKSKFLAKVISTGLDSKDAGILFDVEYENNGTFADFSEYTSFVSKNVERQNVIDFFTGMQNGETRTYSLVDADFNIISELSTLEIIQIFIEEVRKSNDKYLVDIDGVFLPLNDKNVAEIEKSLMKFLEKPEEEASNSYDERVILLNTLLQVTIKKIPDPEGGSRDCRNAGFFPYYNMSVVNLEEQQIFSRMSENKSSLKESCFIYSLRKSCLFSDSEMEKMIEHCKTRDFSAKKMSEVAKSFNFSINTLRRDSRGKLDRKTLNKGCSKVVNIGKIELHYFLNTRDSNGMEIFHTIEKLLNSGKFEEMPTQDRIKYTLEYYKNEEREIVDLTLRDPIIDKKTEKLVHLDYREVSVVEREPLDPETEIWCADFESYQKRSTEKNFSLEQLPILLVAEKIGTYHLIEKGKPDSNRSFCLQNPEEKDIIRWFNSFRSKNVIVYFHHLGYDITQLLQILPSWISIRSVLPMGSSVLSFKISANQTEIEFRCSYKLTTMSLAGLAKSYLPNMHIKKEMCPYQLYNEETKNLDRIPLETVRKYYGEERYVEFMKTALDYCDDSSFFLHKYNIFYCKRDVEILRLSLLKFHDMIKEEFQMNPFDYLTAPSFADAYFKKQGCFDDVYEFSGIPLIFMRRSVVGGRCMTNSNKTWHVKGDILDEDCNSLYPASMSRIDGYPKGVPKIFYDHKYDFDFLTEKTSYYIVEIDIKKVNKPRQFPVFSRKSETGTRVFTNECEGKMIVDKYALEDAVKFQQIEFEVIRGYYWTETNNKINSVIKDVYAKRLVYKKQKDPKQEVFKLIMNSSYGKTIMKVVEKSHSIIYDDKLNGVINNNFQNITSLVKIGKTNKWLVSALRKTNQHFSRPHCGSAILSMSKRIMNEVMCLAEDINGKMYYQDTDSMHIDRADYERLEIQFKELYNRELTGGELGQFSSDYKDEMVGKEGYYLAKKLYGVKISNSKDEEYHLRAKGIPNVLMKWEDYNMIYSGAKIKKNLLDATPGIRTTYMQARIIKDFVREVKI